MFPQPQNLRQYIQFGLVLLCLVCLVPTRLFLKSQKWHFPVVFRANKNSGNNNKRLAIPINNTAECRYFPEAMLQFTNALHNKPESTALKPWTQLGPSSRGGIRWHFPGFSSQLLEDAFGGRKVFLMGDSTLFGMMRWIQTLMGDTNMTTTTQVDALGHMQLMPAYYRVNPDSLEQVGWDDSTPADLQLRDDDGTTHILWDGHRGDPGEEACHFDPIWSHIRQIQPDILLINFGLHWLHLMGGGRDVPLCSIHAWLNYEEWLERVIKVAKEANVKLLLFKTTNYICQDHFWGDYSDSVRQYDRQDAYIMDRCKREIQRLLDRKHDNRPRQHTIIQQQQQQQQQLSDDDIDTYCQKGVLSEFGSNKLNHRLLEFVQAKQQQQQQQTSTTTANNNNNNLKMEIFNDHAIQSCTYSEPNDGRHFHPLNLMRIRLLANMIQCLYPREGEGEERH